MPANECAVLWRWGVAPPRFCSGNYPWPPSPEPGARLRQRLERRVRRVAAWRPGLGALVHERRGRRAVAQEVAEAVHDGVECEDLQTRGITRDYTPFLLILQGMALRLQGFALPPF